MEKECFKCMEVKPLSEFYRHKAMLDGHLNKCKECTKKDSTEHRVNNIERVKEYDRNRPNKEDRKVKNKNRISALKSSNDPKFMETYILPKQQWVIENRHKRNAHLKVNRAIQLGLLKRPKCCSKCTETKNIEAHHEDYTKELEVVWLCTKCHAERHVEIRNEQRSKSA